MHFSTSLLPLIALASIPNAHAQDFQSLTDPTKRAELTLSALQIWYNAATGLWNTCGWWNSANALTMVANLAKYDPDNAQLQNMTARIFANTIMQAPANNPQPGVEAQNAVIQSTSANYNATNGNDTDFSLLTPSATGFSKTMNSKGEPVSTYPPDWNSPESAYIDIKLLPFFHDKALAPASAPNASQWLDGFYDDDLWWALAWINAYDVTKNIQYLQLAEGIFMAVTKAWPTACGNGGIWWSIQKDYMNAIANELFLSTAAHLANRAQNKSFYVDWAQRSLNWFLASGMINANGTINDGLTPACQNNGEAVWSYNQGVILGGLVELNAAAPNATYLPLAARIAKAAIAELADADGVLHDGCEPNCGPDASQFKGVFARNLQALHAVAPDPVYVRTIQASANSIWAKDRDGGNTLSVNWAGPFVAPANASTHSSAMDALVAAITVK